MGGYPQHRTAPHRRAEHSISFFGTVPGGTWRFMGLVLRLYHLHGKRVVTLARYTMTVQDIIEMVTPDDTDKSMYERCGIAVASVFDFTFPLYKEEHRMELCKKILAHYLNWEIGCETYALWKFRLAEKLNIIMPYYNELYKSVLDDFDSSLYNIDVMVDKTGTEKDNGDTNVSNTNARTYKRDYSGKDFIVKSYDINTHINQTDKHTGTVGTEGTDNTTTDTITNTDVVGTQKQSDFPQSAYNSSMDYGSALQQTDSTTSTDTNDRVTASTNTTSTNNLTDTVKADNVEHNSGTDTNTRTDSINDTDTTDFDSTTLANNTKTFDTQTHTHGFQGAESKSHLALEFREAIVNVDMMIVEELKDLFMLLFDSECFG